VGWGSMTWQDCTAVSGWVHPLTGQGSIILSAKQIKAVALAPCDIYPAELGTSSSTRRPAPGHHDF
jgi:hypothetical protein